MAPSVLVLREEQRKWVWRLEGPQRGSQLVPLPKTKHVPSCFMSRPTSRPSLHSSHPSRGLSRTPGPASPGQESELLCSVRGECLLGFPSRRNDPAAGLSMPTLMPVCLLLCPRAPGPAAGWPGLGVQPPPAAHAAAHPSRRGPLTTSASASGTSGWHAGKGR